MNPDLTDAKATTRIRSANSPASSAPAPRRPPFGRVGSAVGRRVTVPAITLDRSLPALPDCGRSSGDVPQLEWPRTVAGQIQHCGILGDLAGPQSIYVDTQSTGKVPDVHIEEVIGQVMDLTLRGIRTHLGLNKPIYARTSAYGHFGRAPEADGGFSWEKTDLVEALKKAA